MIADEFKDKFVFNSAIKSGFKKENSYFIKILLHRQAVLITVCHTLGATEQSSIHLHQITCAWLKKNIKIITSCLMVVDVPSEKRKSRKGPWTLIWSFRCSWQPFLCNCNSALTTEDKGVWEELKYGLGWLTEMNSIYVTTETPSSMLRRDFPAQWSFTLLHEPPSPSL